MSDWLKDVTSGPGLAKLAIGVVVVLLIIVGVAFFAGFSCSGGCDPAPPDLPPAAIDAGPAMVELDAREDAAIAAAAEQLERIEREHQAELDAFDASQRRKYERVREQGPDAVAAWLTDFNRSLRDGGR